MRSVLTDVGAELTDDEVTDSVRLIRDAGGGVHICDEGYGYDDNEEWRVELGLFQTGSKSREQKFSFP